MEKMTHVMRTIHRDGGFTDVYVAPGGTTHLTVTFDDDGEVVKAGKARKAVLPLDAPGDEISELDVDGFADWVEANGVGDAVVRIGPASRHSSSVVVVDGERRVAVAEVVDGVARASLHEIGTADTVCFVES